MSSTALSWQQCRNRLSLGDQLPGSPSVCLTISADRLSGGRCSATRWQPTMTAAAAILAASANSRGRLCCYRRAGFSLHRCDDGGGGGARGRGRWPGRNTGAGDAAGVAAEVGAAGMALALLVDAGAAGDGAVVLRTQALLLRYGACVAGGRRRCYRRCRGWRWCCCRGRFWHWPLHWVGPSAAPSANPTPVKQRRIFALNASICSR